MAKIIFTENSASERPHELDYHIISRRRLHLDVSYLCPAKRLEVDDVLEIRLNLLRFGRARPAPEIVTLAVKTLFIAVEEGNHSPGQEMHQVADQGEFPAPAGAIISATVEKQTDQCKNHREPRCRQKHVRGPNLGILGPGIATITKNANCLLVYNENVNHDGESGSREYHSARLTGQLRDTLAP